MKRLLNFGMIIMAIALITACNPRKVTRVSEDTTIDLSGRWNDVDSRETAQKMIAQALGGDWLQDFNRQHPGEKPVVIAGFVKNKTNEHIDAETFVKDLERAFIKSNQVRVVQGGQKREEIRGERADQQDYSSQETMKKWGREIGADFMLQGDIAQIVDSYKNEKVNFYQVNLELTNIETNEIVWIGESKIKKYINK
jgi:uncharacterized protein (TIGR02722 family)